MAVGEASRMAEITHSNISDASLESKFCHHLCIIKIIPYTKLDKQVYNSIFRLVVTIPHVATSAHMYLHVGKQADTLLWLSNSGIIAHTQVSV